MATKKSKTPSYTMLVLLLVLTIGAFCWMWGYNASLPRPEQPAILRDSIIYKDSLIIDSIFIVNDSIETKIIYIKKDYDEKVDAILNNSDSADYVFFTNYISDYSRTIEDGQSDLCGAR